MARAGPTSRRIGQKLRSLKFIPAEVQVGMKHSQDGNISVFVYQIGDPVMAIEDAPHVAAGLRVAPAQFGKTLQ